MGLIIMKLLNIASFVLLSLLFPFAAKGQYDLERVRTLDGRQYEEIQILDADAHGITFRHHEGITKVPYHRLSVNLRMLYEPVAEVAEAGEQSEEEPEPDAVDFFSPEFVEVTASNRVTISLHWLRAGRIGMPAPCMAPWPSHWPRYQSAHALAYPAWRELAVRDFLYTTGLAVRPPAVVPYSLPRHSPCWFH